jgi:multidrug transporter EmrE-like cation transporter
LTDIALFAAYTVTSVIGLLLLKHSLPLVRTDWPAGLSVDAAMLLLVSGACLYIASFVVWVVILARQELSSAYPTAIGLTLVFSTAGAAVLLGEALSVARVIGIGLIFFGILLVTRY